MGARGASQPGAVTAAAHYILCFFCGSETSAKSLLAGGVRTSPTPALHPPSGGDVAAVGVLEAVSHGAHHTVLQLVDAVIVLGGGIGKEEGRLEWASSTFRDGGSWMGE